MYILNIKNFLLACIIIATYTQATCNHNTHADLAFDHILFDHDPDLIITPLGDTIRSAITAKKDWTFIVYLAADNDLRSFASRNIKQMTNVGSNQHVNILVHLDIKTNSHQKVTRRYLVGRHELFQLNDNDPNSQRMDSGNPETLISCCEWAIKDYPANHYALIFWNHGTGPIDPPHGKVINPASLFTFNPFLNKLELDRSVNFLELIDALTHEHRGVCWDDSTGNYLSNQKISYALSTICNNFLDGKKFDIIGFDACLMSGLEIAHLLKNYTNFMVSSQEVELGTGWHYQYVLTPFEHTSLEPESFAQHIVGAYQKAYMNITNDYTQAALDLSLTQDLEHNIHIVANILLNALRKPNNSAIKNLIKSSFNKNVCTHFDEPSYKDLHHLYSNLLVNLKNIQAQNSQEIKIFKKALAPALQHGCALIEKMVVANAVGRNLPRAKGVSIYLPDQRMHLSYKSSPFAQSNNWLQLIEQKLMLRI